MHVHSIIHTAVASLMKDNIESRRAEFDFVLLSYEINKTNKQTKVRKLANLHLHHIIKYSIQ